MKLELKHIAGYLPYGLKIKTNSLIREMVSGTEFIDINNETTAISNVLSGKGHKPILRPMLYLTKEIEYNGEIFIPVKKLGYNKNWIGLKEHFKNIEYLPYKDVQKLYEWHFDIHGLIPAGLAIDINTLTK